MLPLSLSQMMWLLSFNRGDGILSFSFYLTFLLWLTPPLTGKKKTLLWNDGASAFSRGQWRAWHNLCTKALISLPVWSSFLSDSSQCVIVLYLLPQSNPVQFFFFLVQSNIFFKSTDWFHMKQDPNEQTCYVAYDEVTSLPSITVSHPIAELSNYPAVRFVSLSTHIVTALSKSSKCHIIFH